MKSAVIYKMFISIIIFYTYVISDENYKPLKGYVPTAEVAIQIAVAVWTPIYGKNKLNQRNHSKLIFMKEYGL